MRQNTTEEKGAEMTTRKMQQRSPHRIVLDLVRVLDKVLELVLLLGEAGVLLTVSKEFGAG